MSASEFVSMTLAFIKYMEEAQKRGDECGYAEAHGDLVKHLHDSWNACRMYAFADGVKYQRDKAAGVDQ